MEASTATTSCVPSLRPRYSTAYTPQQNAVAERKNRLLQEMARTMILDADLPKRYWGEAVVASLAFRGLYTFKKNGKGANQTWVFLRIYGCYSYVHILDVKRGKLDGKARKLHWIFR